MLLINLCLRLALILVYGVVSSQTQGCLIDSRADVVLSDQMVDTAGEYSNTFTAPNSIDESVCSNLRVHYPTYSS